MKPNILVLYYTQSGQALEILKSVLQEVTDEANIDYAAIEPQTPFSWPWNSYAFFDAMPETVERIPIPIKPLPREVMEKNYDLVILGYQPWFLNPSQPTTGFLKSKEASFLKGKPVLTVIGCRNMWLNGQEQVKGDLKQIGAKLVGNIVLTDKHPNIISTLTVIRWAFKGQKAASKYLPAAGVADADIHQASRFGKPILEHIKSGSLMELQNTLLAKGAVELNPGLILLEQRGIRNFRKWAKFIRAKGGPGDPNRKGRLTLFKRLLLTAIFILSPISSFTAFLQLQMKKRRLVNDLNYFKGVDFKEGQM